MSGQLIAAIILMTLALTFYSIGVWSEKMQGVLKKWHVVVFWLGFVCDSTGTKIMEGMAQGFQFNLHGVTGAIALGLMAFHAIWATIIVIKNNAKARATFHKFSIVVWSIWLIPYVLGMIIGMQH